METQTMGENAIKWLEALKSGKYKQGLVYLGDEEKGYCCWGVLGCILGKTFDPAIGWIESFGFEIGRIDNNSALIKPEVDVPFPGRGTVRTLWELNDTLAWSFNKIANYLIKNAKTNFIPEVANMIESHFKLKENANNSKS